MYQKYHLCLFLILLAWAPFISLNAQLADGPVPNSNEERGEAMMVVDPSYFIDMKDESQLTAFARALHNELPECKMVYVPTREIKSAFIVFLGWKSMDEVKPYFEKIHAKFPKAALNMAGSHMFTQILAHENLSYKELEESTNKMIAE